MAKSTKGDGSVKQKYPGIYQIRYITNETYTSGRRKERAENVKGTLREAKRLLRQRLDEVYKDAFVNKSRETLGAFLDWWLETHSVSPRTKDGYRQKARYIQDYLGVVPVQDLTAQHVKEFHSAMAA